jgi:hypothetical protein
MTTDARKKELLALLKEILQDIKDGETGTGFAALYAEPLQAHIRALASRATSGEAKDAKRLDWLLLDCDFDEINGVDLREAAYMATGGDGQTPDFDRAYLTAARSAIDAAISSSPEVVAKEMKK